MAVQGRFQVGHGDVFPHGCFMVGEVTPVRDFDRSTKDAAVQAVDKDTGLLVWQVDVIDADPEARSKSLRVKILAAVQPVPPAAAEGVPFRPVEFDGLTVTPYTDQGNCRGEGRCRARQAYSLRATGLRAPNLATTRAGNGRREG